jgi:glycosyltransferase involved in cell wall biosynthesis
MRLLVWQWGRHGSGPRYAADLAESLRQLKGTEAALSLSAQSEIVRGPFPPPCDLPFDTYVGLASLLRRLAGAAFEIAPLARWLAAHKPDAAICAMPAPLDLLMATALRRAGIPFLVVVHDADPHPGDGFPLQMTLQHWLMRRASGLVALSGHVAERLRQQGVVAGARPLIVTTLPPPMAFGPQPLPPRAHGGPLRLLSFGRLLPYKGLDLLADALRLLGPRPDLEVRVVGSGRESEVLDALRQLPGVTVENRWVPEDEVGKMFAWADALVLSHREASQSGVAAAAIAARRWVVATRVGGIAEQLRDDPMAQLCDPTPESLAAALRRLLDQAPPAAQTGTDPSCQWREVAESLVRQIDRTLSPG